MVDDNKEMCLMDYFDYHIKDVDMLAPLVLAYIGDAVYEMHIRTMLLEQRVAPVHQLHKRAIAYVKAQAQAQIAHGLIGILTEKELSIMKRGRNAKSATIPKNADINDYKYATGFEALIGYLFLKKEFFRLKEILKRAEQITDRRTDTDDRGGFGSEAE